MSAHSKSSGKRDKSGGSQTGSQGGTPQQHVDAGRQSHKSDSDSRQSAAPGSGSGSAGRSGGKQASGGRGKKG